MIQQAVHIPLGKIAVGSRCFGSRPVGQPYIKGFARAHSTDKRLEGFLGRGVGVEPVAIEQVYIFETHAAQALVERRQ